MKKVMAVALCSVFSLFAGKLFADGPGASGVKRLLDGSKLKFTWDAENKIGRIKFSDIANADSKAVVIYANDDTKGYFVRIVLTLIDKPNGEEFPLEFLKYCMMRNSKLTTIKISYDQKYGDIDAVIGVDMSDLPAKIFKDYVMALANVGDDLAKELKGALTNPSEMSAPPSTRSEPEMREKTAPSPSEME